MSSRSKEILPPPAGLDLSIRRAGSGREVPNPDHPLNRTSTYKPKRSETKMDNMIFLVEDGEVFEGTAQQLDDCFAITPQELKSWTASRGWDYVIRYDGVEIYNSAVHNDEKSLVERLGKQLGHGRVMELAQECWKDALERDWDITGGEFAIGPCVGMTTECGCECGCDWCGGSRWLTKHVKSIKDWNERDE